MFRFVLLVSCLALVSAQNNYNKNPQHAAILSEQRYLSGDGQFGAAYTQEDGTDFKEETDSDGTRHGSYSYIDPNGQKRTVSYTAGKNGFQATGDHLPVAPPAPPQPIPQPQYQPQPQYNPPQQQQQQQQQHFNAQPAARGFNDYDDGSYDTRYNDPSFGQNGQQSSFRASAPAPAPVHAPAPQQPQYNYNNHQQQPQQQNYNQQPQYNHQQYQTTPQPQRNFQPPGKLQLNRTPDGFSYSFNKV